MDGKTNKHHGSSKSIAGGIALVFPPPWDIDSPYFALPSLTAYLRSKGIRVEQKDLNIECYHDILNSQSLEKCEIEITSLMSCDNIPPQQIFSLAVAKALLPFVKKNIDKAKTNLKFSYNNLELQQSLACINTAQSIVSSLYHPSLISRYDYISQYDGSRLSAIMKGATNTADNIFRAYFERKIYKWFSRKVFDGIGISLTSNAQLIPAFTLANVIKTINPDIPVIMGGAMLPYMRKAIKNFPKIFSFADYFVVGEGETALFLLYKYFKGEGDLQNIPNLLYKSEDNNVIETSQHCEDINELPTPDYTGLHLSLYNSGSDRLWLLTSRGCYWGRCAFCSFCHNHANTYRERDMELVMNDIKSYMEHHNVKYLGFNDQCFSSSRLDEMCEMMKCKKMSGKLKYIILSRLEKGFTSELLQKAYKTGLRFISWGLESGSEITLHKMEKGILLKAATECLKNSHSCGIWNNVFVVLGFPGETENELKATTNYVLENGESIDSLTFTSFRLEGGSDVHKEPEKYGIRVKAVPQDYIGPCYSYYQNDGSSVSPNGIDVEKMKDFLFAISPKHYCSIHVTETVLSAMDIIQNIENGLKGKQKLRAFVKSKIRKKFELYNLVNRIESLLLWLPEYVEIKKINGIPEEIRRDTVIINHKTGNVQIPAKKVTPYILKALQEKTTFPILLEGIVDKLSKFGKDEISKEVKDVCCFLLVTEFLQGEL